MPTNNPPTSTSAKWNTPAYLYTGAAVLILIVVTTALHMLMELRGQAIERAVISRQAIAKSVELNITETIETINVVLAISAEEISRQSTHGPLDQAAITYALDKYHKHLPYLLHFRGTNEQGDILYGPGMGKSLSLTEREYFAQLKNDPKAGLVINKPFIGRISGMWCWSFGRRINKPDGSFGGVVFATLPIDYINKILSKIKLDEGNNITVRDPSLNLVTRLAYPAHLSYPSDDPGVSKGLINALKANAEEGNYIVEVSGFDGDQRSYSYVRSERYGFLVNVGIVQNLEFAEWRKQLMFVFSLLTLFISSVLISTIMIRRWVLSQEQVIASLNANEQFTTSVLNSLTEHIAVLDQDGTIIAVNRAWEKFAAENSAADLAKASVGVNYLKTCEGAQGQPLGEEAAGARIGILAVLAGDLSGFELEYPCHSEQEQRWFMMRVSPLQGEGSGVVVSHENISARKLAEEELRESERRYNTLFSDNSVVMLLIDPLDGQIVDANSCASAYYGWDLPTLRTMKISEINTLPPEQLQEVLRRVRERGDRNFEFPHRLASGEIRDVEVFTGPVKIGERQLVVSTIIDITERVRANKALQNAQALTQHFLDHLPGTAFIKDNKLRVLMASRGFQTYLGIDPASMIGKTNSDLFPGGFGEKIDVDDMRILESGKTEIIEEEYQNRQFESIKFAIQTEDEERLLGGVTLDITERHKLLHRQRALLEIAEISLFLPEKELLNRGLTIVEKLTASAIALLHFVNDDQETIELVNWTDDALKAHAIYQDSIWADCFHDKRSIIINDYENYRAKKGLPPGYEFLQRMAAVPVMEDGHIRMMIGVGNKDFDYDDADILTIQLIGNDLWRIVRRKRVEATLLQQLSELKTLNQELDNSQHQLLQSEKLASIGQLAAGVAHEINNPISFVQSNFGSLAEYVEDLLAIDVAYREVEARLGAQHPQAFERVRQLKKNADYDFIIDDLHKLIGESREGLERVRRIVQDLRDFSRVGESDWQWVDLHQGIDSTLNIVANEIKYKAEVRREYGVLPLVRCIPAQINQVFMNLLVNAGQSIASNGHITIRTGSNEQQVWIEVKDDGKGIAPENVQRIFDPFFTTKPVGEGTGLGLSLSWGIVQRHGGTIEVESEPGRGTTFRVTLPVDSQVKPDNVSAP